MIDCVTVKGSKLPVRLYTYDIVRIPASIGCYCRDVMHFQDAHFDVDSSIKELQQVRCAHPQALAHLVPPIHLISAAYYGMQTSRVDRSFWLARMIDASLPVYTTAGHPGGVQG
jgi:hypothetical protein